MESEWLREALRFSLKATTHTSSDTSTSPSSQLGPRLRKLFDKILWSRKFVLTYHIVIVGFIALLSAVHWTGKWTRWKRRQASRLQILAAKDAYDEDAGSVVPTGLSTTPIDLDSKTNCSSRSSTVDGTASPLRKDQDEATPLLSGSYVSTQPRPSFISAARSILMYQSHPIPVINKSLPSNGTSIVVLTFLALNVFYTFYDINPMSIEFVVLADRFGLVFVVNIPLLYLLAAKNQPLKFLTGRSYESLNIFHRRLGEVMCLEGFLHSAGFMVVWYVVLKPSGFGLLRFLLVKRNLIGIGMLLSYELLFFTSFGSFRQRWYELFLGLHVVLQFLALVGMYFHHETSKPYVLAALVIFLSDRVVYRLRLKTITVTATTKILEDEETVRLSSSITLRPRPKIFDFFNRSIDAGWQATDHIFITIPSLSHKHIIQAHPFTIASAAPNPGDAIASIDLLIRAQDGFSRDLLNAARLHKHLSIRIDGPYGSSHARNMLEDSGLALVVAGGSGIAVGWPLVKHLLNTARSSDIEIGSISSVRKQRIVLIWVIHETAHLAWIGRQALATAENMGAEIVIPRATEEIGRPDLGGMIGDLVNRYAPAGRTRVVASGPDSMGRQVRNTCAGLVRRGRDVDVAIEKFGW